MVYYYECSYTQSSAFSTTAILKARRGVLHAKKMLISFDTPKTREVKKLSKLGSGLQLEIKGTRITKFKLKDISHLQGPPLVTHTTFKLRRTEGRKRMHCQIRVMKCSRIEC